MELPGEMFVKLVDGADDTFAFRYDFTPESKALGDTASEPIVTELENGDLLIRGYAAVWEGTDRQGENFEPGAFQRGIKSFIDGQAGLCFHHKHDQGIGKVLKLEEDDNGLRIEARVDKQEPGSPLYHIYNGVRKESYKGLSVGGFFKRRLTENGWKIADVDFTEVSVTPVPVHPGTSLSVVAGKALEDLPAPKKVKKSVGDVRAEDEDMLRMAVDMWNGILERIEKRGKGPEKRSDSGESIL